MNTDPPTPENDANLSALGRELLDTGGSKPSGPWVPPTAEELHAILPQYEIVKMLGRGGMGAVYMGTQTALERPVAIKILSAQLEESDMGFTERFKNEAKAMAKLNHPGIVAVYDFGEAPGGLLYIVMEYVDGTDVAKMLAAKGRLHTEHAMAITAHVCDALSYAHERGIIHRDIKPANIMVGYDGEVKVADFGLAKVSTDGRTLGLTQSGMAMGTLHYMAPEALMLGSAVDHRADIYAVGVMLYQMLTGKIPQGMFKMPSLLVAGLDPRYDSIIAKSIMEDREARYQSAREMRLDLDSILTQPVVQVEEGSQKAPAVLPTTARPQRPSGQPPRSPQAVEHQPQPTAKSSMGWIVGAVLGVLALGGVYLWMNREPSAQNPPVGTPKQAAMTNTPTSTKPVAAPPAQPVATPAPATTKTAPAKTAVTATPMPQPKPSTPAPPPPVVDLKQLPDFRTRVANYQKARHAQISDLAGKYRSALTAARTEAMKTGVLANVTALDDAISRATALTDEIEKNLTSLDVKPLTPLPSLGATVPQRLKDLRAIFDRETANIESSLVASLDQSLATVQRKLIAVANVDAGKAVETHRKQLVVLFSQERPAQTAGTTPPASTSSASGTEPETITLFDGKSLNGWRLMGDPAAFKIDDGSIMSSGAKGNLFYVGSGAVPQFRDFDLRMQVKMGTASNSGVWLHSQPVATAAALAVEAAIAARGHPNKQKTGGLFGIQDVYTSHVADNTWFEYRIVVKGKEVVIYIDGREVNRWEQPSNWVPPRNTPNKRLGSGTIGLQSHTRQVWFKDITLTVPPSL